MSSGALLLLPLIPMLTAEPAFPGFHCGLGTNSSPGSFGAPVARLGLLGHLVLWTEQQLGVKLPLQ